MSTPYKKLQQLATMQLFDSNITNPMPCPRCGGSMHGYIYYNALSLFMDIYICSNCEVDEAMGTELPFADWSFIQSFRR